MKIKSLIISGLIIIIGVSFITYCVWLIIDPIEQINSKGIKVHTEQTKPLTIENKGVEMYAYIIEGDELTRVQKVNVTLTGEDGLPVLADKVTLSKNELNLVPKRGEVK